MHQLTVEKHREIVAAARRHLAGTPVGSSERRAAEEHVAHSERELELARQGRVAIDIEDLELQRYLGDAA